MTLSELDNVAEAHAEPETETETTVTVTCGDGEPPLPNPVDAAEEEDKDSAAALISNSPEKPKSKADSIPDVDQESLLSFGDDDDAVGAFDHESVSSKRSQPKFGTNSDSDDEIGRNSKRRNILDSSDEDSLLSLDKNYPENAKTAPTKRATLFDTSDSEKSEKSDSDASADRSRPGSSNSNSKQKHVRKMTMKQRDEKLKELKSKTERMKREAPLKLPYHRPEVPSLNEFLERRNKVKADFQNSVVAQLKLKCHGHGGLGMKKIEEGLFKFEIDKKPEQETVEELNPLDKMDVQVPFSSKVDDWMKTMDDEIAALGETATINHQSEDEVNVNNDIKIGADSDPEVKVKPKPVIVLEKLKIKQEIVEKDEDNVQSDGKIEEITLNDEDDGQLVIDENIELVDLEKSAEIGGQSLENQEMDSEPQQQKEPKPNEVNFKAMEAQLQEFLSAKGENANALPADNENEIHPSTPAPRKKISDLLKALPNHDQLLQMKPKIGARADVKSGFIDLNAKKPKNPTAKQEEKMRILYERYMKHTAVHKKPKEQHFTLHVAKKQEDSQGDPKIVVNEVDYVQIGDETDDLDADGAGADHGSPSQVPGARLNSLRNTLRAKIQEKKKIEYQEKLKRFAMDNEEKCLGADGEMGKDEEEDEEEIMDDEDMTESEPELTDEEELEKMREKEKKRRMKKKSAFVEDEADVEEDEEEGTEVKAKGNDDDDDDESKTSCTESEDEDEDDTVEIEDDLLSIKSGNNRGEKKFQRVIKIDDSSDDEESKMNQDQINPPEVEKLEEMEEKLKESQNSECEFGIQTQKSTESFGKNSQAKSMSDIFKDSFDAADMDETDRSADTHAHAQHMFSESMDNGSGNESQPFSFSQDDLNLKSLTTPRRTTSEIENLFNPQVTPSFSQMKFSGQIDSQRPETPSPAAGQSGQLWAMPKFAPSGYRPSLPLPPTQSSSLFKVNSSVALDYFLEDNPKPTSPTSIPVEICKLFDSTSGALPFGSSDLTAEKSTKPATAAVTEDLMALCSGNFPSQAPATPEESQQVVSDDDDDDDQEMVNDSQPQTPAAAAPTQKEPKSLANSNITPILTPVHTRQFNSSIGVDNETPKMSEKIIKTTRLFQQKEESETNLKSRRLFDKVPSVDLKLNDDDDEKESVVDFKAKIIKKRKRLQYSDDEDEADDEDELDGDDDSDVEAEEDEEEGEPGNEEDEQEEMEIVKKPVFKGIMSRRTGMIRKEFVDAEAELSGSELGSGDEDERGLDELDEEEGDGEKIDLEQLRDEVGKAHLKQLLDEDQRQVRMLQEQYLEHGDLHMDGKARERQFKWKNIDDMGGLDAPFDEDENPEPIDEAETQRQNEKVEKLKWMRENSHLMESDGEDEDFSHNFLGNSKFLKIRKSTFAKIQSSVFNSDTSMSMSMSMSASMTMPPSNPTVTSKLMNRFASVANMDKTKTGPMEDEIDTPAARTNSQPFFPSPEDAFSKIRKGSFLSRGSPTLSRLAEMTKISESVNNAKANSRNFVFTVVTPPAPTNSEGGNARSRKQTNPARRTATQPKKKMIKIDRSFSSLDATAKKASVFGHL